MTKRNVKKGRQNSIYSRSKSVFREILHNKPEVDSSLCRFIQYRSDHQIGRRSMCICNKPKGHKWLSHLSLCTYGICGIWYIRSRKIDTCIQAVHKKKCVSCPAGGFLFLFFLWEIIQNNKKKKIVLKKWKKKVPSRPFYGHPAATPETYLFLWTASGFTRRNKIPVLVILEQSSRKRSGLLHLFIRYFDNGPIHTHTKCAKDNHQCNSPTIVHRRPWPQLVIRSTGSV